MRFTNFDFPLIQIYTQTQHRICTPHLNASTTFHKAATVCTAF